MDEHCLGPDVDRAKIAGDARIVGSSYLSGSRTSVAAGAIVRNSRLDDVVVEAGAIIVDSIIRAEGHPQVHKCDAAGRTVVRGADQPRIAAGARVENSTLLNTSVGPRSRVSQSWLGDSRLGEDCTVIRAKLVVTNADHHVTVHGPTEISEAWLGHHATIDRRGYFEGIFSNRFLQLRFDTSVGRLRVAGEIDLPHVSRYGLNTVNSTNSGKLLPRGGRPLAGFGQPGGLWRGQWTLNHEQVEFGPCAWVVPWTKVVGQSPLAHESDEALVNDELTTYLMPLAMAGVEGGLTRGLVMPGELSFGFGPKQRRGAWVFTYAPDAVVNMVARLHEVLPGPQKAVADTIVIEAIHTALAMTRAMAHRRNVDLAVPAGGQKPGWPRWIADTWQLLRVHLDAGLWQFKDGQPLGWRPRDGRWTHPKIEQLLSAAPDALDRQRSESQLFECEDPVPAITVHFGSPAGATGGPPIIDPAAQVDPSAWIGPGCRLEKDVVVGPGAKVWGSHLFRCRVEAGAVVEGSTLAATAVERGAVVRGCRVGQSTIGPRSTAQCAHIRDSRLASETTVSALAEVVRARAAFGAILGGSFHDASIDVFLMSMHLAGLCRHLRAVPFRVRLEGREIDVPAVPMIGGGAVIRGQPDRPVELQCSFIGSNASLEPGSFVAFGSFILGCFGPDQGILPLSISTDNDPRHHQIGAVLGSQPSVILTHYIPWTYNAAGAELAPAVGAMIVQAAAEGLAAIAWEQARRAGQATGNGRRFARYKSLSDYSDEQLAAGAAIYRRAAQSGAWEMAYENGELRFTSPRGEWHERSGTAYWREVDPG